MKRVSLMIVLLLLGSAFLAQNATAAKTLPGKKSVCVISEIAQRFQLKKIGIMVFGNEEKTVPIESWKLDDKVYAKTKALLAKDFNVKKIPAPYELFQPLHEQGDLFRDSAAELKGMVQKAAEGSACDFYLVPACGGSQFSSSNQSLTGLGVVETGSEAFGYNREIYALSYLYVYDGKSFELIRSERGGSDKPMFFQAIRGPSEEIDAKAHASLQAVADDPKTRDIVWALLEKSLSMTLPKLFDIGELAQAAQPKPKSPKQDWVPF